jgi:arylsulfatase A-like enzyme
MYHKYFIILILILVKFGGNAQLVVGSENNIVRPNILWIVCEDMSPHLSCFGEKVIQTPNLDALAKDGVIYTNVYTVAGVCAPSRHGIITGMYPMSNGADNMRNYQAGVRGSEQVTSRVLPSYSVVPPPYVKCFPEYLRKEGYYTTNNAKQDYQFEAPLTVWDESGNKAHWRNRPDGVPFFSIFNLGITHESRLWERDKEPLLVDPAKVEVPPYYPDVPEVRKDIARFLSNVMEMDKNAGEIIQQLKDDGLYESTLIFFYSDHGDALPFVKREVTKRGLHVPLIVKFPNNIQAGQKDDQLLSAIDFAPTILSVAGVAIPFHMHGRPFLGFQKPAVARKYIHAARDRMDSEVDRVRTVFDGRYQYIRNFMPEKPYYQHLEYRMKIPSMQKMLQMRDQNQLNKTQMLWFRTSKPIEELYDTQVDPHQFVNLAKNSKYKDKLAELRKEFERWQNEVGDKHVMPEVELCNQMWGNASGAPITAKPEVIQVEDGFIIKCVTPGASIGWKIKGQEGNDNKEKNSWKVYDHGIIHLKKGDELIVRAQRIGYEASDFVFLYQ